MNKKSENFNNFSGNSEENPESESESKIEIEWKQPNWEVKRQALCVFLQNKWQLLTWTLEKM